MKSTLANGSVPFAELCIKLVDVQMEIEKNEKRKVGFRTYNKLFSACQSTQNSQTTELLKVACELLLKQKSALDEASFEEHSSDFGLLCRHLSTDIENGLPPETVERMSNYAEVTKPQRSFSSLGEALAVVCDESARRRSSFCCATPAPRSRRPSNASLRSVSGLIESVRNFVDAPSEFPPNDLWWRRIVDGPLIPSYEVLRGGSISTASEREIFPGDIFYLDTGQKAPCDARVLAFSDGCIVNASEATKRINDDMRTCELQQTSPVITESRNIILRRSSVAFGSVLCMSVRWWKDPILCAPDNEEERSVMGNFEVDTRVPPKITGGKCRQMFKRLCVNACLVAKSFQSMLDLASVTVYVIVLSEKIVKDSCVAQFCNTANALDKTVILINGDVSSEKLDKIWVSIKQRRVVEVLPVDSTESDMLAPTTPESTPRSSVAPTLIRAMLREVKELPHRTFVLPPNLSQSQQLFLLRALQSPEHDEKIAYCLGDILYPSCFFRLIVRGTGEEENRKLRASVTSITGVLSTTLKRSSLTSSAQSSATFSLYSRSRSTKKLSSVAPTDAPDSDRDARENESEACGYVAESYLSQFVKPENEDNNPDRMVESQHSDVSLYEPVINREADDTDDTLPQYVRPRVILSLNSMGVISNEADLILFRNDLRFLGNAIQILQRGFRAVS